jgi:hypothetical protein
MTREEAIEVYNGLINPKIKEAFEFFAPELKESGDEWFIKELQGFLESYGADYFGTGEWQKFHDWLEKHKEPIPIPDKFSGLKSLLLQYLQSAANRTDDTEIESDTDLWGRKILDYVWKYSEKQKEQKPSEWSKENEDTYNRVYCLFRDAIDEWYTAIFSGCYPRITKDKVLAMLKSLRPLKDCRK